MRLITDLKPALARLTKLSTLAVASTAVAAAATTWLITGSVDPSHWLAAYEQSRQPAIVHLQESHQPDGVGAAPSPTPPPAVEPSPDESNPAPPAAQPSSTGDDDGSEAADD